jgi:hypothetical protein
MSIQKISTANTFYQWVVLTQKLVPEVNDKLVNFTVNPLYSNTNINVAHGLVVGGNVNVGGTFILDQSNIDDLNVSGNLRVGNGITALTGVFTNLAISSNLSNVSVNTTVAVGTDSNVYGRINVANKLISKNLTATGNLYFHNTNVYATNVTVQNTIIINGQYRPTVTNLSVTNSGSSAFLFGEYAGNNPTLNVRENETLVFNLNVPGHPFLIRESNGGTLYNNGLSHLSSANVVSVGAAAQAQILGTLYWTIPFGLAGNTYVYQCQIHSGMVGNIIIGPAQSNATFSNSTTNYGNFETANMTLLLGQSNTRFYSAIGNSRFAVESASNVAAMTAFVLALG